MTACGKKIDKPISTPTPTPTSITYDETIYESNPNLCYHIAGGFNNNYQPTDDNKMTPTSIKNISVLDIPLANTLMKKSLMDLYTIKVEIKDDAYWTTNVVINNEVVTINAKYSFRFIWSVCSSITTYSIKEWIPYPQLNHLEALTNNIFIPPYQKDMNEYGFNWDSDPALIGEEGTYEFVLAKYTNASSLQTPGFGVGVIRL